jgi:ribonuclease BN (tRNA processing enzyme)
VVGFAKMAEVKHLVLFHHDPYHPDNELASLVAKARMVWGSSEGEVVAAWEGMTIDLSQDGVALY